MRPLVLCAALACLAGCDVTTADGSSGEPIDDSARAALTVANESAVNVDVVNVSPCPDRDWGPNGLTRPLVPGATTRFDINPGCWDLRAVTEDGRTVTRFGVDISPRERLTWRLHPSSSAPAVAFTKPLAR